MGALAYIYSLANIRRNELVLDGFLAACWMIFDSYCSGLCLGMTSGGDQEYVPETEVIHQLSEEIILSINQRLRRNSFGKDRRRDVRIKRVFFRVRSEWGEVD